MVQFASYFSSYKWPYYVSISVHSPRDQARVFFKIFYMFLAPGGARTCHTGFFDCKLVDRKKARPILERKVCMFINSITYLDNKS